MPPGADAPRPGAPLLGRGPAARWELYRLLADPMRPRLLALASVEELAVGELAELLREGQPKISRHTAALRDAGLLSARRQGTWTLLRLAPSAGDDPVVADAIRAGLDACRADGTLARVDELLEARDAATREFFARAGRPARLGPPHELGAYLTALAPLIPHRRLAIDAGSGDGSLLEVLAPIFERVIALDRSGAQLALAAERIKKRDFGNVTLVEGELDGPEVRAALRAIAGEHGGADVVFASRVLHHAPVPARAMRALAELARPASGEERAANAERGGVVCVLDYEAHDDQALCEQQADLWLGFEPAEIERLARDAGLVDIHQQRLPVAWQGEGPDRHLTWQLLTAFRGARPEAAPAKHAPSTKGKRPSP